jgi:hypothetical protein
LRIVISNVKSVLLYGWKTCKVTQRITRNLQALINKYFREIIETSLFNIITNEGQWRRGQKKPLAMQIKLQKGKWNRHTEKGFLCHSQTSFEQEPPKTTWKMKTTKELEENDTGGS